MCLGMVGPTQRASAGALERAVSNVIADHGELDRGEIVTHFDLVVETRVIDAEGCEHIRRHHWSPTGSDPHLSYALMSVEASRVLRRLSEP